MSIFNTIHDVLAVDAFKDVNQNIIDFIATLFV